MRVELPWPFGGLSEETAYDKQPPNTTSDADNVRNYDHHSGRVRGSKRPGRSKHNGTAVDTLYPVRELQPIVYVNKTVDYALDPEDEIQIPLPGGGECRFGECDGEGNIYCLDPPASISKFSSSLTLVQTFKLPTKTGASVGTLDVDEQANVFCGVSGTRSAPAGLLGSPEPANGMILGDKDKAQLFMLRHAFRNNDDKVEPELEVAWTITTDPDDAGPTVWGLVTHVRVRGGKLYTIQQDNRQWRSWLVIYDSIYAGVPVESRVHRIPYPANSLDVDLNGRISIAVENFTRRGENPAHPEIQADLLAWDPAKNIDDDITGAAKKHRFFAHYKIEPQYIVSTGGQTPDDNDEIIQLLDASGNGRHIKFMFGKKAGLFRSEGLGGLPELYLDGSTMLYAASAAVSGAADFRKGIMGLFPTYKDPDPVVGPDRSSQYVVVAILRPEARTDGTTLTNQYPVWNHGVANSTLADQSALMINRGVGATPTLDTLVSANNHVSGAVSWFHRADATDPGEGSTSGLMPMAYHNAFDNFANALLVSCIACNGVDYVDGGEDETRSLFRVWGLPIDRFTQEINANFSVAAQYLGGTDSSDFNTLTKFYKGGISEIIVLDRKSLEASGNSSVCSHPPQPDSTSGNIVGQLRIDVEGSGGSPTTSSGSLSFSGGLGVGGIAASGTWASINGKLTSLTLTSPGQGYTSVPTVTLLGAGAPGGGAAVVASLDFDAGTHQNITILEKIEGYLAWKYGVSYLLGGTDSGFLTYQVHRANSSGDKGTYTWTTNHPYFYAPSIEGQGPPENADTVGIHRFSHMGEILIVMDSNGKLLDVKSDTTSGYGLGCRWSADGTALFTVGSSGASDATGSSTPIGATTIRKWDVDGEGVLTEAWTAESSLRMSGQTCGIKVDKSGNLYVPCNAPIDTADAFSMLVLKGEDGSEIHRFNNSNIAASKQGSFCIILPRAVEKSDLMPDNPDYEEDLTDHVSEFVYILGSNVTYGDVALERTICKYRLVTATPNGAAPRSRADTAVANGVIYDIPTAGPPVAVTGETLFAADGGVEYVHSVSAFDSTSKHQLGYYTDGAKDVVYDPKTGIASPWLAVRGELPKRCRILELWRGRVVRTGNQDFPGAVDLSRVLRPDDWDKDPPVPTVDQACDFSTSEVGDMPDRVTGFCPYSDDVAVIFCDASVWVLRGDPMVDGQKDLVSDITGGAFGRAWCKDPEGRIWFFGSRGGLYTMAGPGAIPERVSRFKIEKRLSSLDLVANYIRMVYDADADGIWIMVIPYAAPEEVVETYFYEMKQGAFWPDYVDSVAGTVTAIAAIDGDQPDDRRVLFGHGDGFVRYADPDAVSDDGVAIRARVLLGPFKGGTPGRETRVLKLGCQLAADQNGLAWSSYASDQADATGAVKRQGVFGPGTSVAASCRMLGSYHWFRFEQTSSTARFSMERAWVDVADAGRQRVRS